MKITIVCLAAMLASSCRPVDDGPHSGGSVRTMVPNDRIREIVKEHFADYAGHEFEIKGPLTLPQIEQELAGGHVDEADSMGVGAWREHPDWRGFMSRYRRGDDIYYFKSDKRSWTELNGIKGYVIVHRNRITGILVTGVS